jgi:hypothetical protein
VDEIFIRGLPGIFFTARLEWDVGKTLTLTFENQFFFMSNHRNTTGADTFLLFGKRYNVDRVISNAFTGPIISPRIEEIELAINHVTDHSNPERADNKDSAVVFYMYEGKYIVLLGFNRAAGAIIDAETSEHGLSVTHLKGRLLTKHNLKRCLVDNNTQVTARIIDEQIRDIGAPPRFDNARFERNREPNRFNSPDRAASRDRNPRY